MEHACNRCIRRYAAQVLIGGRRMALEEIKFAVHETHSKLQRNPTMPDLCTVDFLCAQCLTETIDLGESSLHLDGVILALGEPCPYSDDND